MPIDRAIARLHDDQEEANPRTPSVSDYPDVDLLKRAVRNSRSRDYRKGQNHMRWIAVMDTFELGSTYAHQLCRRFGLDPDEMVKR